MAISTNGHGFSPDQYIFIRGVPVTRLEVYVMQERLGAQLFDESMFRNIEKRKACADVIYTLDQKLGEFLAKAGLYEIPDDPNNIIQLDIGDPSWYYIPIKLFPSTAKVIIGKSKDRPAGVVAWFRARKTYQAAVA